MRKFLNFASSHLLPQDILFYRNLEDKMRYISSKLKKILVCATLLTALQFSAAVYDLPLKRIGGTDYYLYVVNKGDDIFAIAEKLGVTRSQIVEYNSAAADGVKAGMKLYFPAAEFRQGEIQPQETAAEVIAVAEDTQSEMKPLSVVICLPFDLAEETLTRNGEHSTDFYKGFLLGIDSLRTGYDIAGLDVRVVDCGKPEENLNLASWNLPVENPTVLIAPEAIEKISQIGKYARSKGYYVLNVFQTRDASYLDNPYMLQTNIPADEMYDKALDWLVKNLNGRLPVFLDHKNGKKDKQQFVDALIERLNGMGIEYNTVSFEDVLTGTDLENALPEVMSGFVFIPMSGDLKEFQKISSALASFKSFVAETNLQSDAVMLFGYPEFTRFTGDSYDKMKTIGTIFYSRFYNSPDWEATKRIEASYKDRYGTGLPVGVPNQALYGFDVASWILTVATNGEITPEVLTKQTADGVQTSYNFKKTLNGGFYNNSLYIVKIFDEHKPEVEILR